MPARPGCSRRSDSRRWRPRAAASQQRWGAWTARSHENRRWRHAADIVTATQLPVSADMENGFADEPASVAGLVHDAIGVGLAGFSIEDYDRPMPTTRSTRRGWPPSGSRPQRKPRTVGRHQLVVTARAENHLHGRRRSQRHDRPPAGLPGGRRRRPLCAWADPRGRHQGDRQLGRPTGQRARPRRARRRSPSLPTSVSAGSRSADRSRSPPSSAGRPRARELRDQGTYGYSACASKACALPSTRSVSHLAQPLLYRRVSRSCIAGEVAVARAAGGPVDGADSDLQVRPAGDPDDPAPHLRDRLPGDTTVPTGTSAGSGMAVVDVAAGQRAAGRRAAPARPGRSRRSPPGRSPRRSPPPHRLAPHAAPSVAMSTPWSGSQVRRLDHRQGRNREHEALPGSQRVQLLDDLQLPPDLGQRRPPGRWDPPPGRPRRPGDGGLAAGARLDRLRVGRGSRRGGAAGRPRR